MLTTTLPSYLCTAEDAASYANDAACASSGDAERAWQLSHLIDCINKATVTA